MDGLPLTVRAWVRPIAAYKYGGELSVLGNSDLRPGTAAAGRMSLDEAANRNHAGGLYDGAGVDRAARQSLKETC